MRIAVYEAEWAVTIHLNNLLKTFEQAGWEVDLFLYDILKTHEQPWTSSAVHLHDYGDNPPRRRRFERELRHAFKLSEFDVKNGKYSTFVGRNRLRAENFISELLDRASFWLGVADRSYLLPHQIVTDAIKALRNNPPDLAIGIDALGLIWAQKVCEYFKIPLFYYSLEVYTEHHAVSKGRRFKRLRRCEAEAHRGAAGTIIQDQDRANHLLQANHIGTCQFISLPVSVPGPTIAEKSRFAYDLLDIPINKKLVISFGMFGECRFSHDFILAAQALPDDWLLLLHSGGLAQASDFHRFEKCNDGKKAILSTKRLCYEDCDRLIQSCHIGIAFYGNDNINDRLTGRSSEKAARYAKYGLPIIANKKTTFSKEFEVCKAGALIDNPFDLAAAVEEITADYDAYQSAALQLFNEVYCFDLYTQSLIGAITLQSLPES